MSKFLLNQEQYKALKGIDLGELQSAINFSDEKSSFEMDDVDELLFIIDEQITMYGLSDDQESANEYGKKLYDLYDSICAQ